MTSFRTRRPRFVICAVALVTGLLLPAAGAAAASQHGEHDPGGAPTLTGFAPAGGQVGSRVAIYGTNLVGATVAFGGVQAAVVHDDGSQLVAVVPSGATTGAITVTVGGTTLTSSSEFSVTSNAPTVAGFEPTSGAVGSRVTVFGTNLRGATVNLNGTAAAVVGSNPQRVTFLVPSGATSGAITVSVNGVSVTSGGTFTVASSAPTISGFRPASGKVGSRVTIFGTNLFGATVSVNGTAATVVGGDAHQVTFVVPSGATSGAITVSVNGVSVTSGGTFTVASSAPTISGFRPASGKVGSRVTIFGANLSGATVAFGSVAATVLRAGPHGHRLTVTVPSGATSGPITVTVDGASVTSAGTFTVTPGGPTIAAVSAYRGRAGTRVVIHGTNLYGATVSFHGVRATVLGRHGRDELVVIVPRRATRGHITVTVRGATASSKEEFTILALGHSPRHP